MRIMHRDNLFSSGENGKRGERLAVILAGGEGSRLKGLTRVIAGDERPKQFCPILGDESLLEATAKRAALKIASENIYFSLTAGHERFFRSILKGVAPDRLVVQPENKGTAPAILYSLLRLAQADPDATVAFFPSDHYFSDDDGFMETVETAYRAAEANSGSVILLGIEPATPETSYGWIEPSESLFGELPKSVSRVKCFWEKPARKAARHLMTKGCLWNSFVMVGRVGTFLALMEKHLPSMFGTFRAASATFGTREEVHLIRSIYEWIRETNFSSEVLERSAAELFVLRVGDVGWSDWGEPQRVLGTLETLGVRLKWMQAAATAVG